ncbi:hypothetical protein J5N97_006549 [Dioscorea zingiberensis]|uniref:Uncharacterized protein n=1 Tax=Dioscorea zingiberensis TaxID=325984 RepID=A0A9D5DC13_9LILI|nr:hypothetical protein J5N97_006549 [Dioscorea zingiberensis]
MGKQKMVLRLTMEDDKKRSKAMQIAVSLNGVISAGLEGEGKDKLVVVGDGVDSIKLTMALRKKMGHVVELLSVAAVEEKKDNKSEGDAKKQQQPPQPPAMIPYYYPPQVVPVQYAYDNPADRYDPNCSLM